MSRSVCYSRGPSEDSIYEQDHMGPVGRPGGRRHRRARHVDVPGLRLSAHQRSTVEFPHDIQSYDDADLGIVARLTHRVKVFPFNLLGTVLFVLAIAHTFLTRRFRTLSHRTEHAHEKKIAAGEAPRNSVSHAARLFHFLGEVEVVFGLWCVPLLVSIILVSVGRPQSSTSRTR